MGYDPKKYYSGRSPLEALSIGVPMKDTDVAIRCNIVTISEEDVPFEEKTIIDHSSSEISTEDCAVLLQEVMKELANETYQFYVGTSYRHCLIWDQGSVVELTPPHDVLGRVIGEYLPQDEALKAMMKKSYDILVNHPINIERKKQGLNPANCCWFWGAGTKPMLDSFEEKTGKKGMMVSAVDLLKGIAVGAGMSTVEVEGANGGLHTNYAGKVSAALKAIEENDLVYVHLEAIDECSHLGDLQLKLRAIEEFDAKIVAPILDALKDKEYNFAVLPDHPVPIKLRKHTTTPVPLIICGPAVVPDQIMCFSETLAPTGSLGLLQKEELVRKLLEI
jgi:2,3-bisphosphoglycerate-independent phosphoglycerate mutase